MKTFEVVRPVNYGTCKDDLKQYQPGDSIELTDKAAEKLLNRERPKIGKKGAYKRMLSAETGGNNEKVNDLKAALSKAEGQLEDAADREESQELELQKLRGLAKQQADAAKKS